MVRESPAQPAAPLKEPYPAEKARGGTIILDTPARRRIFIAGLVGAVLLVIILGIFAQM
jgi:hypothetical protein